MLASLPVQAEVTLELKSDLTGEVMAELTESGQFSLYSSYQPENDIPAQRAALENLYYTTQGQNWTRGAYYSTVFLEQIEDFAYAYANYTGKTSPCQQRIAHATIVHQFHPP